MSHVPDLAQIRSYIRYKRRKDLNAENMEVLRRFVERFTNPNTLNEPFNFVYNQDGNNDDELQEDLGDQVLEVKLEKF